MNVDSQMNTGMVDQSTNTCDNDSNLTKEEPVDASTNNNVSSRDTKMENHLIFMNSVQKFETFKPELPKPTICESSTRTPGRPESRYSTPELNLVSF